MNEFEFSEYFSIPRQRSVPNNISYGRPLVGQKRSFVPPVERDPHLVLRFDGSQVYIKYTDKSTEWHTAKHYYNRTRAS